MDVLRFWFQRGNNQLCYKNALYLKLAGHPRARRLYNTFWHQYYWLHMPQDVHCYATQCDSCRRHPPSDNYQQWLKLFPPSGPFAFVALGILALLMHIKAEKRSSCRDQSVNNVD